MLPQRAMVIVSVSIQGVTTPCPKCVATRSPCHKGVSGMDAGLKPTRMYSRRPLRQGDGVAWRPEQ